jgi:hypothetical protein
MSVSRFKVKKDSSTELAKFLAAGGSVTTLSVEESNKSRKSKPQEIDFNALPPELRAKYVKQA